MKRLLLFIVLILAAGSGIFYFLHRPIKLLNPLASISPIYELSAVLNKNDLTATAPIYLNPETIQASVAGVLVDFSPTKDFDLQVRALQLVLPKVKMVDSNIKEIDLRFNNIVLKY